MIFVFRKNLGAEISLKILTNYKYNFPKSTTNGIVNRIVHDGFAMRAKTIKLLQSTITAAHAGSKHK